MSDATDAPIVTVTANSAAAIGNAVYDALGIRVRTLPLSPENITAAMPD
jgi:CO/xanthine dehydrogenase Mo-binding subunit